MADPSRTLPSWLQKRLPSTPSLSTVRSPAPSSLATKPHTKRDLLRSTLTRPPRRSEDRMVPEPTTRNASMCEPARCSCRRRVSSAPIEAYVRSFERTAPVFKAQSQHLRNHRGKQGGPPGTCLTGKEWKHAWRTYEDIAVTQGLQSRCRGCDC